MNLESKLREHEKDIDLERWWNDEVYRKKFINETKNIIAEHFAEKVRKDGIQEQDNL